MRAYVITMMGLPQSVELADRCIDSAAKFRHTVWTVAATTPIDNPREVFEHRGWPTRRFDNNPYSRPEPCMATFLSHELLWWQCGQGHEPYVILEHDAVFKARLPLEDLAHCRGLCNLGKPSFGAFKSPALGLGPLKSKRYMPGAHAYYLHPEGARALCELAKTEAEPTDVFLNVHRFPWLQEFYPWPVVADDSFSTIQRELGCKAKHNEVVPL